MTFQFDTSGAVERANTPWLRLPEMIHWSDLDPFTQGYVEALFAELHRKDAGNVFHSYYGLAFHRLHHSALAAILADCAARKLVGNMHVSASDGQVFWMERQRGQWPEWPPRTISLADDGKVHLSTIERAEGQ